MSHSIRRMAAFLFCSATLLSVASAADGVTVLKSLDPVVGSSNPVSAAPRISRPSTTPCVVPLFSDFTYDNWQTAAITYTPPKECPGPWAKAVMVADISIDKGSQYDRTAVFSLGGVNIYYGTTAEPNSDKTLSWHVERDVTDLSALFKTAQTGEASIGNCLYYKPDGTHNTGCVGSGGEPLTAAIHVSAALEFYPTSATDPAPSTPDKVYNVSDGKGNNLKSGSDSISATFTILPTNTTRVYLDLIEKPGGSDEFWWDAPNPFREAHVSVDGDPAGIAPLYPWIYTGGAGPTHWIPIPGLQTLNLKPYRLDLTPFAASLNDGKSHTISINIPNANDGIDVAGTLLLFTDPVLSKVTGGLAGNNPMEFDTSTKKNNGSSVTTSSSHDFTVAGYVNSSEGKIQTAVTQKGSYTNTVTSTRFATKIDQSTDEAQTVSRTVGSGTPVITTHTSSYPFTYNNGVFTQTETEDNYTETVVSDNGSDHFIGLNENGTCYDRTLIASNYKLKSITDNTSSTSCSEMKQTVPLAFEPIPDHTLGDAPFTVSAISKSTGTLTYKVLSGPATLSGNTLTVTGVGTVVLSASQAAKDSYNANTAMTSFKVKPPPTLVIKADNATRIYGAANPTFTGTVTGQENGDIITASFATTATTSSSPGTYPIKPTVRGTNLASYKQIVTDGILTVTKASSEVTLTVLQQPSHMYVALTASVRSTANGRPTGNVQFFDGTTLLGTQSLAGSETMLGTKTLLADQVHNLIAVYEGDTYFAGSRSSTINFRASQRTLTITTDNKTRSYGAANPTFTGTVTGQWNGDPITATFATAATANSLPGTYPIRATVSGADLADYRQIIANGTLTITKAPSAITLTVSQQPSHTYVALTALVRSTANGKPTGDVQFFDGTTLLGTRSLSGSETMLGITTLLPGKVHHLKAIYKGDAIFAESNSPGVDWTLR